MISQKSNQKVIPKTWVEISKTALSSNLDVFKRLAGKSTQVMAVVKANAYGHGSVEVARLAEKQGIKWFGVDSVQDGLALRKNGVKSHILVMGYTPPQNVEIAIDNGLSLVAYDPALLNELVKLSHRGKLKSKTANMHLKIETGTARQGLAGKDLYRYAEKLSRVQGVKIQGCYTHFANIEDTTEHTFADEQLRRFNQECDALENRCIVPEIRHAACSAAAMLFNKTYFDMIRLGIAMYGLWPSKETKAVALRLKRPVELKSVLTWKTTVAQVKRIPRGTGVGYGLSGHATRTTLLAVLPVGYWDGYDRGLSNVGHVLIRNTRCKILGRICMNMMMVDVTDARNVRAGDQVILLGGNKRDFISADELAGKVGTINYEIVTRINPLLPRVVVK